jgi:hypothetical protein
MERNGKRSVDVKQSIKVDLNTLKSKGDKGVPQAPLGTAISCQNLYFSHNIDNLSS